jgi:Ca2+-binding EF-hand superfamily protein
MQQEDFKDRPAKLIAAFRTLDSKKTGKMPTALFRSLVEKFGPMAGGDLALTSQELEELIAEADSGGVIEYERFVKDVVFGPVK